MDKNKNIDDIDNFLSKEEILKLFEPVAEGANPIMIAKDACYCGSGGNGNCSCTGTAGTKGCC